SHLPPSPPPPPYPSFSSSSPPQPLLPLPPVPLPSSPCSSSRTWASPPGLHVLSWILSHFPSLSLHWGTLSNSPSFSLHWGDTFSPTCTLLRYLLLRGRQCDLRHDVTLRVMPSIALSI